jgi:hypothetical protein
MPDAVAYWIDPDGNTTAVETRHINAIIADPARFGLTDKYVRRIYRKHREILGVEGNAREEIMTVVMKRGWIRCRQEVRRSVIWKIQCYVLNERATNNILGWIRSMARGRLITRHTHLTVIDPKIPRFYNNEFQA